MRSYILLLMYVCSGTQMSFCCHSTTVKYTNKNLNSHNDLNVLYVRVDSNYFCFEMTGASVKLCSSLFGYFYLVIPDNYLLPEHVISRKIYNSIVYWFSVFLELESFPGPLVDQETIGDDHWRTGKGDLGFSAKIVTYYVTRASLFHPYSPFCVS